MNKLQNTLSKKARESKSSRPIFFNLSKKKDRDKIDLLLKKRNIVHVTDEYLAQLEEYFQIINPSLVYGGTFKKEFKKYLSKLKKEAPLEYQGVWVYYPWMSHLVHILDENAFFKVRTARNKNLITEKEQENYYKAIVGIAGMSVGNSVALAIVLQGGAKHIKLADFDTLELSNTNRIRTGVDNLGIKKVHMTAREIYLINPYAKIEIFTQGLATNNIVKFFKSLNIVIDEIDNLGMKYLIRERAKKQKIPLIMGADNGDNIIVDIERYDAKEQPEFFHGRMGKVTFKELSNLNKFDIGKMIVKHLGIENITERTFLSFIEMGKTLVSWPQLGGAASMNGTVIAYFVRRIINNQPVQSNRIIVSLDEKIIPSYLTEKNQQNRIKISNEFKKILKL